jgi:DNA modification methylase
MVQENFNPSMISPTLWKKIGLTKENPLHQLSPYIGKMKSTMARELIQACSKPNDLILDPFVGSGIVALESLMAGRNIISCDINPYAVALTRAKITAPLTFNEAINNLEFCLKQSRSIECKIDLGEVPKWVQNFFHPKTLVEALALMKILKAENQYFLIGCLLGILHHQRPGFLSYPASHAIPYLRSKKFPRESFPEMYSYRDVKSRIIRKIYRVYAGTYQPIDRKLERKCFELSATELNLSDECVDAVVTSPPYMNTLDYVRDNRLRLWFIDENIPQDTGNPKNLKEFEVLMYQCFKNIQNAIRPNGLCVIVTGEVKNGATCVNTSEAIIRAAEKLDNFTCETIIEDDIPAIRRVRRDAKRVKKEWIVVLRKRL